MAYLDETGLATLRARLEAVYERRDMLIGSIFWWSGTLATIPSNAKVCNGQTLSSSTYSKLYAKISTKYGGNSTNFALPDLRIGTASANGRFIRARFDDTVTTQDDAIRNIKGYRTGGYGELVIQQGTTSYGALGTNGTNGKHALSGTNHLRYYASFDANGGTTTDNPMAGHANGDDIHPYNISMIPIIIVS